MKFTNGYYLDENQGEIASGQAFGYIGRTDTNGNDYQGWFFTYPNADAEIWTVSEREQVLESLELASEEAHCKPFVIEWRTAYAMLDKYLRATFDLRRTPASVERNRSKHYVD